MPIRFLRTEGFRLSALYAGIFSLSILALGVFVLVITDQALRDQIIQFSSTDIAAVRNGYALEGTHEAREIVNQLIASDVSALWPIDVGAAQSCKSSVAVNQRSRERGQ